MSKQKRHDTAIMALAYALYDAENTTRMGEALLSEQAEYINRARALLTSIVTYRPHAERKTLSQVIRG